MYASSNTQANRPLSRHAQMRSQQRGISVELVDLLLDYGQERHIGQGATVLSFPKRAKLQLRTRLSREEYASISSKLDVYAVIGDHGSITTLGHRYQPLRIKH